jgi:hypothetical protein
MLWKALSVPNFVGDRLRGFLDGSFRAPPKTVSRGWATPPPWWQRTEKGKRKIDIGGAENRIHCLRVSA